jgi:hypothetical protein
MSAKIIGLILLLFTIMLSCSEAKAKASCRSPTVKHRFDKLQGYPHGRKGYIVDHVCALECGGKDSEENMQYQTSSASKAKDRWERTAAGCKSTCTPNNSTYPDRKVFNCK